MSAVTSADDTLDFPAASAFSKGAAKGRPVAASFDAAPDRQGRVAAVKARTAIA